MSRLVGPSPEARAASIAARAAAARVLRSVRGGSVALPDLLTADEHADDREALGRTCVQRLLRAVPGVGPEPIMRICRHAEVDRLTLVSALSPARRRQLADAMAREVDLTSYSGSGPRRRAA